MDHVIIDIEDDSDESVSSAQTSSYADTLHTTTSLEEGPFRSQISSIQAEFDSISAFNLNINAQNNVSNNFQYNPFRLPASRSRPSSVMANVPQFSQHENSHQSVDLDPNHWQYYRQSYQIESTGTLTVNCGTLKKPPQHKVKKQKKKKTVLSSTTSYANQDPSLDFKLPSSTPINPFMKENQVIQQTSATDPLVEILNKMLSERNDTRGRIEADPYRDLCLKPYSVVLHRGEVERYLRKNGSATLFEVQKLSIKTEPNIEVCMIEHEFVNCDLEPPNKKLFLDNRVLEPPQLVRQDLISPVLLNRDIITKKSRNGVVDLPNLEGPFNDSEIPAEFDQNISQNNFSASNQVIEQNSSSDCSNFEKSKNLIENNDICCDSAAEFEDEPNMPYLFKSESTENSDFVSENVPYNQQNELNVLPYIELDNLTKYVKLYGVKDTTTKHVLISFNDMILRHGMPSKAITDRGTAFSSIQFKKFCELNGIHHVLIATRHPRAQGQVERVNRTVLPLIISSMSNNSHKDWDKNLLKCERDLNCAVNDTTGKSPFQLLHGYQPRFHNQHMAVLSDSENGQHQDPSTLQDQARKSIIEKQHAMKVYFDKTHCEATPYNLGQVVFMKKAPDKTGESTKTQLKYRGPLVITKVLPSDTYEVTSLLPTKGKSYYVTTAYVTSLKAWSSNFNEEYEPLMSDENNQNESLINETDNENSQIEIAHEDTVENLQIPSSPVQLTENVENSMSEHENSIQEEILVPEPQTSRPKRNARRPAKFKDYV